MALTCIETPTQHFTTVLILGSALFYMMISDVDIDVNADNDDEFMDDDEFCTCRKRVDWMPYLQLLQVTLSLSFI